MNSSFLGVSKKTKMVTFLRLIQILILGLSYGGVRLP